ncbi:hypothetical protein HYH02_010996 [Chlamydomonas schloesseri]|uniref:CxC3 like cysteine cluster domain-containing protein n=1 Tax=Chlamydomonas schloesseri TaxID=2026947 RepID=A0A835W5W4_9CHLO|nr:hypothetical protein HYH02_010996 [Chlamydomonas schloesseri]|eukprot:KAG2438299.1 hypothetical protein HYH02_010996 [Chlamydomonas schloesseri]
MSKRHRHEDEEAIPEHGRRLITRSQRGHSDLDEAVEASEARTQQTAHLPSRSAADLSGTKRTAHFSSLRLRFRGPSAPNSAAGWASAPTSSAWEAGDDAGGGNEPAQGADTAQPSCSNPGSDLRVPAPAPAPRSRELRNLSLQQNWEAFYPGASTHSFTWAALGGATAGADIANHMRRDFTDRAVRCLAATCDTCPQCASAAGLHGTDSWIWLADGSAASSDGGRADGAGSSSGQMASSEELLYVTLQGSVAVTQPSYTCKHCSYVRVIHSSEMGCFPSTPKQSRAWFDVALLRHVQHARAVNPTAASALSQTLALDHAAIGHSTPDSVLKAVPLAATHLARVEHMLESALLSDAIRGDSSASQWLDCPACWRCCVAISGDACMGLRRFKAAARSSMQLKPLYGGDLFVSEDVVATRLEKRQKLARTEAGVQLEGAACSDFKAAKETGSRTAHYDRMGVAAIVCRHGFVISMASLLTPENFVYYELLLEAAAAKMDLAAVKAVFLDVACKFEGYYERMREADADDGAGLPDLTFAIGPWHIKPHKPECHVRYNSRLMEGLGLTFGDLIEHLWADIRKHWYIMAYMSPAARQDFMTMLIKHRHMKKEDGLAAQLISNVRRALREEKELEARIAELGAEEPMQNPREELLRELAQRGEESEAGPSTRERPSLKGRAPWRREYLEKLERYYYLSHAERATEAGHDNPQLRDAREELRTLTAKIEAIENKKDIVRWAQNCREFREAVAERRAYKIAKAEQQASALALSLAQLQADVREQGSLEVTKKERIKQRVKRGKARAALLKVLGVLEGQLRMPDPIPGWVTYTAAQVRGVVVSLQELRADAGGRVQLPWEPAVEEMGAAELWQRRQRCMEECTIAARELADMAAMYALRADRLKQRLADTRSSIDVLQSLRSVGPLTVEAAGVMERAVSGLSDVSSRGHVITLLLGQCERIKVALQRCQKLHKTALSGQSIVAALVAGTGVHGAAESPVGGGGEDSAVAAGSDEEWEGSSDGDCESSDEFDMEIDL